MSDLFVIPTLIDPDALSVEDCWAERKLTGVHLLKNWGKLTLQQCCAWQQDSFDYASLEDLTSMEWAKSLMMKSCDALLIERIDKKFKNLSLYKQGGVTFIKLALDEMFTISNTANATLQGFFENFAKDGIAKVPNEDVHVAMEQIVAIAERLVEVSALPSECTVQLLEGLTKCSITVFRQTYSHLLVGECLRKLRILTTLHKSSCLGGIKKLCKEANNMFNALNVSKEYGIFLKSTASMHVSIAVILTMASQSALNPSINLGLTEPSPSSPDLEVDVVAVVVAIMAAMAAEADVVRDVGVVMAIKPTHAGSGKAMPRL